MIKLDFPYKIAAAGMEAACLPDTIKVGDLVTVGSGCLARSVVGVVIGMPFVEIRAASYHLARIGVLWPDGSGVDWEPIPWVKVVNESR